MKLKGAGWELKYMSVGEVLLLTVEFLLILNFFEVDSDTREGVVKRRFFEIEEAGC